MLKNRTLAIPNGLSPPDLTYITPQEKPGASLKLPQLLEEELGHHVNHVLYVNRSILVGCYILLYKKDPYP
jgi:hypothetical protein